MVLDVLWPRNECGYVVWVQTTWQRFCRTRDKRERERRREMTGCGAASSTDRRRPWRSARMGNAGLDRAGRQRGERGVVGSWKLVSRMCTDSDPEETGERSPDANQPLKNKKKKKNVIVRAVRLFFSKNKRRSTQGCKRCRHGHQYET